MLDAGFRVFPLLPNGKKPEFTGWQKWSEEAGRLEAAQHGKTNPNANWGVNCELSGIYVVDIDSHEGKKGKESRKHLEKEHGSMPCTFTVETPTGGCHIYFTGRGSNTAGRLGPGIDTRGKGGYVVCPGSVIDGKQYHIIDETMSAQPLPPWIGEQVSIRSPTEHINTDGILPDQPHHIKSAVDYLKYNAPESIEGGGGNTVLYTVACRVKNMGISDPVHAQELMREHYDCRCVPSWISNDSDRNQWEKTINSAYKGSQDPVCSETPEALISEAEKEFRIAQKGFKFHRASDFDMADIPKRDWLLGSRYIKKYISAVISPGGIGKSSITLNEALAVVTGRNDIAGADVHEQGNVWMHSTEEAIQEAHRKLAGLTQYFGVNPGMLKGLIFTSGTEYGLTVAREGSSGAAIPSETNIRLIKTTLEKEKIKLLIVDPFVRIHRLNENDNSKIDMVMDILRSIAEDADCAIGLVHHCPKLTGVTAYRGNMDMSRGAGATVAACRNVRTLDIMNSDEAKIFGIADNMRWKYVRMDDAKANLAPPAENASWFQKHSVFFDNLKEAKGAQGVGVVAPVDLDRVEKAMPSTRDLAEFFSSVISAGEELSLIRVVESVTDANIFNISHRRITDLLKADFKNGYIYGGINYTVRREEGRGRAYVLSAELCSELLT